jgi:hypothetical protein
VHVVASDAQFRGIYLIRLLYLPLIVLTFPAALAGIINVPAVERLVRALKRTKVKLDPRRVLKQR